MTMPHDDDGAIGPRPDSVSRAGFLRRLAALAVAGRLGAADGGGWRRDDRRPRRHPAPRAGITAGHVPAPATLPPDDTEVLRAYDAARASPELFDGLACVCSCVETMHHRSLLSCYETTHPATCPGCLDEAAFVGRLARQGQSLDDVRRAVDRAFGT